MIRNGGGFTLFETMITLAVSGTMLVMAVTLFGGQQRRTQFAQSLRDLESSVSDNLNDVSTGYYPSAAVNCTPDYAAGPQFAPGTTEQGANLGCIYVGKALHFQADRITLYTLVGNRFSSALSRAPAATFASSLPVVSDQSTAVKPYLGGVTVREMYLNGTLSPGSAMLVLSTTTNEQYTAGGDTFNTAVQRIIPRVSGMPAASAVTMGSLSIADIYSRVRLMDAWNSGTNNLTICFEDATSGIGRQKGGLIITGGSSAIQVRQQTDSDLPRCT